jgi:2,3-bisphosphoglycerate-dependent phosphoglycerate mutase
MGKLAIVRHGQSRWNKENRFTGWADVDLTDKGIMEAKLAGERLRGLVFDEAFTSGLQRAQRTLNVILHVLGQKEIFVHEAEALNERHYGDLQGLNKQETREKFGEEQVHIWRRSFDIAPPNGESLKDTADRVIPYFEAEIAPLLRDGKNILIAAHGNSLRALRMHLEKLTPEEIVKVEIGTGQPMVYDLDAQLNILSMHEPAEAKLRA